MAQFMFAYHGNGKKPESPEAGAQMMEEWKVWIVGLGAAVINPGTPLGKSKTVSKTGVADDGGPNPLSGYSVIEADSIEGAVDIAKDSPFIFHDQGTIEIAEIKEMPA